MPIEHPPEEAPAVAVGYSEPEAVLIGKIANLIRVSEWTKTFNSEYGGVSGECLMRPIEIDAVFRKQGYDGYLDQLDFIEHAPSAVLLPEVTVYVTKAEPGDFDTGDTFSLSALDPDDILGSVVITEADYLEYQADFAVAMKNKLKNSIKAAGVFTGITGSRKLYLTVVLNGSYTVPEDTVIFVRTYYVQN
ncbi:hypothetical protein EG832_07775 [bacterium]|nr:hypothetical protein [bacterium]